MTNLIELFKIQLLNLFGVNKVIHTNNRKEKFKFICFSLFICFSFISLIVVMGIGNYYIAKKISDVKYILNISVALSSLMIFVATIYKGSSIIFSFKDYDIIVSLPIKTNIIALSRIFGIYSSALMVNALFLLPTFVVYCMFTQVNAIFFIMAIFLFLLSPIVPLSIATFLSIVFSLISSKFKRSNIVNLLFDFIFFIGVALISFNKDQVLEQSDKIVSMINKFYPLAGEFTASLHDYNLLTFFIFTTISIVVFAVFIFLVSKYFKPINTILTLGHATPKFNFSNIKYDSPLLAMYKKDFKFYLSSSNYVSNTAFGLFLLTMSVTILLITADNSINEVLELADSNMSNIVFLIVPFIISIIVAMSCTTSCSISLENKNLWILKSSPVKSINIFNSKIFVNLTVSLPFIIINSILFTILLNMNMIYTLMSILIPFLFSIFIGIIGILMNLSFPNFTWTNEINAIKQSASVILTVVIGIVSVLLAIIFTIVLLVIIPNPIIVLIIITTVLTIINLLLYIKLNRKGTKKFLTLLAD